MPLAERSVLQSIGLGPVAGSYGYCRGLKARIRALAQQDDAVIIYSTWQYHAYATWRALHGSGIPYFVYTGILLFLSRIHLKKRLDLLIEAFATVASSHPRLQQRAASPIASPGPECSMVPSSGEPSTAPSCSARPPTRRTSASWWPKLWAAWLMANQSLRALLVLSAVSPCTRPAPAATTFVEIFTGSAIATGGPQDGFMMGKMQNRCFSAF
jgi:hypothetical protein